jgi:EAL domain-containing protein (putative c-di-GMP-specific phosphodiesterase class I)
MLKATDRDWEQLLDRACRERLISPVFQPIVDIARGVVCGYEGLSRFPGGIDLGGPEAWFAAAAWHGYSGRIEAQAVTAILNHRGELPSNAFLSVNLSPGALHAPEVREALSATHELSGVVFEITEQTPVEDYEALDEVLADLRARGAMIAVDDTGAGYASLSHLLALRPQFVKLDRKLVTGVDHDASRAAAVAAIGAFAGELDAWLIAEGVETADELVRLTELSVPLVQGYFLGRPAPTMQGVAATAALHLSERHARQGAGRLAALARPAPVVRAAPNIVAQITVLVDDAGRPLELFAPEGGRRLQRYAAMCVQPHDDISATALRATARASEHRYAPLCLCDDLGRLTGVITIARLLEALARGTGTS